MKKYIIAAAAALAIGMALSACAKEEEAIVPIIVEGEAEQQAAPTPEATQDMAAQVSKTQTVEGTGYTATLTEDTDGDGGLIYRLKASAGGNEEEQSRFGCTLLRDCIDLKLTDVTKKLAEEWKELSDKEKEVSMQQPIDV